MLSIPPRRQVSGKLMVAVYVAACSQYFAKLFEIIC